MLTIYQKAYEVFDLFDESRSEEQTRKGEEGVEGEELNYVLAASLPASCAIAHFFPILTHDLGWLLVSVLDIASGEYVYTRNFQIE